MPLARLELAPRVNPDWILSPTRLPIPPQGLITFLFNFQSFYMLTAFVESVDESTSPPSRTILNRSRGVLATRANNIFYSIFNL